MRVRSFKPAALTVNRPALKRAAAVMRLAVIACGSIAENLTFDRRSLARSSLQARYHQGDGNMTWTYPNAPQRTLNHL